MQSSVLVCMKALHMLGFFMWLSGMSWNILRQVIPADGLGPVVQSIVSLTSLLRGQLVECFTTLFQSTRICFVEKKREAFSV